MIRGQGIVDGHLSGKLAEEALLDSSSADYQPLLEEDLHFLPRETGNSSANKS